MRSKILKKSVFFMLCFGVFTSLIFCVSIHAETKRSADTQKIQQCISGFFSNYEKKYDNYDYDFGNLAQYFVSNYNIGYQSGKTTMELILLSDVAISQACSNDLAEKNKKVSYKYSGMKFEDMENATVKVTVTKTFNYVQSPKIASGCADTYTVSLFLDNGNWRIYNIDGQVIQSKLDVLKSMNLNNSNVFMFPKEMIVNMIREQMKSVFMNEKKKNQTQMQSNAAIERHTSEKYNRKKAIKYAAEYALHSNNKYYNFSNLGTGSYGDCTNFISQCLYEGGDIDMHKGPKLTDSNWYYTSSTNRSTSWTGAAQFQSYIFSPKSRIAAEKSTYNNIIGGDIIQFTYANGKAYHSLLVTNVVQNANGQRTDLLVCCHSNDRKNISLLKTCSLCTKQYYHVIGSRIVAAAK